MWNLSVNDLPPGRLTTSQFTTVSVALVTCGVIGFLENLIILMIFFQVSALLSPTNIFVMAVVVCDILVTVTGLPLSIASSICHNWLFGRTGCYWYGFIMSLLGYMTIFLLTAISIERYCLITKALPRPMVRKKMVAGVIFLCFVLSTVLAGMPVFGWSSYTLEAGFFSCSIDWNSKQPADMSYLFLIFTFCFVAPIGIMAFCYFKVYRTVHVMRMNGLWGKQSHAYRRNLKMEYRTTRNVILMIGSFLLCWTPYSVVALMCVLGNQEGLSPLVGTVPAVIAKSSVIWNPLVYVLANKQFRTHFFAVYPCKIFKVAKTVDQNYNSQTNNATIGLTTHSMVGCNLQEDNSKSNSLSRGQYISVSYVSPSVDISNTNITEEN